MNERVHQACDGDLDPDDLTLEERREHAMIVEVIEDLAHALRSVPAPDLTRRVMFDLRFRSTADLPATTSSVRSLLAWLWRPRRLAFSWRPAYVALVTVLLFAGFVSVREVSRDPAVAATGATTPPLLYVQFRLEAPGAASVELAGSFTNWSSAVRLAETAPGVWSTLVALEPGVHDYAFVIDGSTWVADPIAPRVNDGFGGVNSRLFLTRPDGNV